MNNQKQSQKTQKNPFSVMEEEVLDFWDKSKTFEKSVEKPAPQGDYVFYDGPPFGTGEPHYGHLLSSISKDVVPRYWTMKGYRVERKWGWDCHGLPIENIIEKDMDINGKKEIEKMGVAKFNEACRSRVLEYAEVWDVMIRRIARWVEFKNSYKTMDASFMESVWWGFKELWNKDLIYKGRKVLLYCPRCETPISNFEVAMDNSYKDITETSVYVKFKVKKESISQNKSLKEVQDEEVFILAWTTTPWTLPGNVALAVGSDISYVVVEIDDEFMILAKDRIEEVLEGMEYKIVSEIKGKDLVGLKYEPLFDVPALRESKKKVYEVLEAGFVTTEDGTGIVHTAVVYGEDDYNLGLEHDLPVVPAIDEKGHFNETVPQYKGMYFKKADKQIVVDLEVDELLFKKEDYTHSYPFCHRCETQLFYNAIPAWFLSIQKIKKKMLEQNKKINWYPEHLKEGRFGQGIEKAPDWNISRNRYFATPMPIWECDTCEIREVVGSIGELEKKSDTKDIKDIHSHFIDDLEWSCKCGGSMKRIREVFDCWVESGSMSFAQLHYPFENKEKFESIFPAQYITEYISQTRAWFYVMHVMSTALFDSNSYENVVTTGVILNEKGDKMSKSKKNYPDPWKVIDQFGVDALRVYLMSSTLMHGENLFFNERELRDIFRKNIMLLWNVVKFYDLFVGDYKVTEKYSGSDNILDKWIIAKLNKLIKEYTEYLDNYDLPRASRLIEDFVDDLSTWYLRRSRDRFKGTDEKDKQAALETTGYVLLQLSKVIAPFMPFMAEQVWQKVTGNDFKDENKSVHLEAWSKPGEIDDKILQMMGTTRNFIEVGLAKRDEYGIKVRQPLSKMTIKDSAVDQCLIIDKEEYINLIKDEVNVKEVLFEKTDDDLLVDLDKEITPELKQEGMKRELVRFINALRKNAGLTIKDNIVLYFESSSLEVKQVFEKYKAEIMKDVIAEDIKEGIDEGVETRKEVKANGEEVVLGIVKK